MQIGNPPCRSVCFQVPTGTSPERSGQWRGRMPLSGTKATRSGERSRCLHYSFLPQSVRAMSNRYHERDDQKLIRETVVNELERTLIANGVGAPPAHVLEAIDEKIAHRRYAGAPHSIYEEVWHLAFWQQLSLDWIAGKATPYPAHASDGFPTSFDEAWS